MKRGIFIIICILLGLWTTGCQQQEDFGNNTVNTYILDLDENFERVEEKEDENILRVYDLGEQTYSVVTKVMGFEGMIFIDVRLEDQAIHEVKIIHENESEGYGHYIVESWFLERFQISGYEELKLTKYFKEQEDEVVAVTGATISSQAVLDAVNNTLDIIGG